jgi:hypothetical protein
MGGTSREYLRKRLLAAGRHDLIAAVEQRNELSYYGAAEAAGLVTRRATVGDQDSNQSRRRHFAIARAIGQAPPLEPKSEPAPAQPKFSPEDARLVAELVKADQADVAVGLMEKRISRSEAARLVAAPKRQRAPEEREEKPEPKKWVFDPAAVIG